MARRPTATAQPARGGWRGGLVSIAFWLVLFLAVALFGGVALAPKLVRWHKVRDQYVAQQVRLVHLERHAAQLEAVVKALRDDPQFAAELARLEFDALAPGEEVIAVAADLSLDPRLPAETQPLPQTARSWSPLLAALAGDRRLRTTLLASAAVLVIVAFTWLQEPDPRASAERPESVWRRLQRRYRRPDAPAAP